PWALALGATATGAMIATAPTTAARSTALSLRMTCLALHPVVHGSKRRASSRAALGSGSVDATKRQECGQLGKARTCFRVAAPPWGRGQHDGGAAAPPDRTPAPGGRPGGPRGRRASTGPTPPPPGRGPPPPPSP